MKKWSVSVAIVLAIGTCITVALYLFYDRLNSYFQGIAIESAGVLLEIILLVAVLGFYEQKRDRRNQISRLRERIEDVKCIDDPHAHGIIASAIRGLAKHQITNIDLRGVHLTDFSFPASDIESIKGTVFSDGIYSDKQSRNFTELRNVDFMWVNCKNVKFGTGNLSWAKYEDCKFLCADLKGAKFTGASLAWTKSKIVENIDDWTEEVDQAEDGSPIYAQKYVSAFEGADLKDTNFREARLRFADFRGAKNVLSADFTKTKGLGTCYFDEGVKEALLSKLGLAKVSRS